MILTLQLDPTQPGELASLGALIARLVAEAVPATPLPFSEAVVPSGTTIVTEQEIPTIVDVEIVVEAPAPKKRNPREKKVAPVVEAPAPVYSGTVTTAPSPATSAPTLDSLREAMQSYVDAKGMPAALELLKDFAVARVRDLIALPVDEQLHFLRCVKEAGANA